MYAMAIQKKSVIKQDDGGAGAMIRGWGLGEGAMRESQFIDWIVLAEANVKLRSLRKLTQVVEVGDFGSLDHTRLKLASK